MTASVGVQATVVIPARDAEATLGQQLDALARQTMHEAWEVLVIDNGSTDRTAELALSYRGPVPGLRVLRCDRRGANASRNVGAAAAVGEYLLFCDADDVVDAGWVEAMISALREGHPAVGGRIDDDALNERGDDRRITRHPPGVPVTAGFLPRAITANLAVTKHAWASVGGFNEEYDYGSTDTEFCWRLQLAGFPLSYDERAVVAYRHRGTLLEVARKHYRTGLARARLYRDYRSSGMPQPRLAGAFVRWARLVFEMAFALVSVRRRWTWVAQAAGAVGRLVGSARFGVTYL